MKKIAILYPPLKLGEEYPLLSQNRQFKYTNSLEIRIYPVIMSTLATMLKQDGNNVLYYDGINERVSLEDYNKKIRDFKPDIAVLETKAPIIRRHWKYIEDLKKDNPVLKVILIGDHVCYFPEESLENSNVDYVIHHGDYDFIIRELVRYLNKKRKDLPGSIYWKAEGKIQNSGESPFFDLDDAPEIDRELTRWDLYGEAYLHKPVAYILSGRGCGGANNKNGEKGEHYSSSLPGRCAFCIWQYAYWKGGARMRSPEKVALEIKNLVEKQKVKEIFDDNESGAVWNKEWLNDFFQELQKHGLIGKVRISSNARADSLHDDETIELLKKCGYRLLKIGVETGNNETLKILKKDETIEDIKKGIKNAKKHGLVVLMTTMVGYPWETEEDARITYETTRELMLYKTHFGDSLQASIVVPYPGTPLFREAEKNSWFRPDLDFRNYEKYDMAHQILKTGIDSPAWCKKMWKIHLNPVFLFKSFLTINSFQDLRIAFTGLISLFGHLKDYEH